MSGCELPTEQVVPNCGRAVAGDGGAQNVGGALFPMVMRVARGETSSWRI